MLKFLSLILLLPLFCKAQSVDNLDIKNGFLQFRLGDSISKYKSESYDNKKSPNQLRVKPKFIKLHRYVDDVVLNFENGLLFSIEINIQHEDEQRYMNVALKKAYGDGTSIQNSTTDALGHHNSYIIWTGKSVVAILKTDFLSFTLNGKQLDGSYESLTIKKTSDIKADGILPTDFPL